MRDWRDYHSIAVQLKSIMREACGELPQGADHQTVEAKINTLQCALDEVEGKMREMQIHAEMMRAKDLLDHQMHQTRREEERMHEMKKDIERRQKATSEMQEEKLYLYSCRNRELDAKIETVKEFSKAMQAERIEKAEAEGRRREEMLRRLEESRARAVLEHKEKSQKHMKHGCGVLKRRKQREESERRRKPLAFVQHKTELERCQPPCNDHSRQIDCNHVKPSQQNGNATSSYERNRELILRSALEAHEKLLQNLKQKEEQHKMRYEEKQAIRQYEQELRAAARKERQVKQQRCYLAQLEDRLRRGAEIIEKAQEKKHRGKRAVEENATRDPSFSDAISRDVEEHKKRAETLEKLRCEKIVTANYRRWNARAARVFRQLQEMLQADDGACTDEGKFRQLPPLLNSFTGSKLENWKKGAVSVS